MAKTLLLFTQLLVIILHARHAAAAPSPGRKTRLGVSGSDSVVADAKIGHAQQQHLLHDEDFVVAMPTATHRMELFTASRCWRAGIRTFGVLNCTNESQAKPYESAMRFAEHLECFPDEPPASKVKGHGNHAARPGDIRAAMAPFLAHKYFKKMNQKYKWMLYGDDDTMFFMESVRGLLRSFDPSQPLAIADSLWYQSNGKSFHPNPDAPRCLACYSHNDTRSHRTAKEEDGDVDKDKGNKRRKSQYEPPRECPGLCTPRAVCSQLLERGEDCTNPGVHGGAGAIFSYAFMELVSADAMWACINQTWGATGGDALVSECLWAHNLTFTDPGAWAHHDWDPNFVLFDPHSQYLKDPFTVIKLIKSGHCNAVCEHVLERAVSVHIGARSHPTAQSAASTMQEILVLRRVAQRLLGEHKAQLIQ